ncbi:MAG: DUF3168 domain-containing protein [Ferrovibrio sp.]|uniref:DUF3168 domain-containing protein n=1 Tax=Ferrovibrio sp. TaxID=1917215 RepID=UPI00261C1CC5|nr:DUF3168 domain-containing protein [Ferrovibrio sp.]MCW0235279.1 DUF3168 domain-containing protein [Ferrovibrio sp.]
MTDTILEIQGAVTARLKNDGTVTGLVGARVYDNVPLGAPRPYISFGPSDAVSDDADCIDADEITLQIDCWSEESGFVEVRRIADAVRRALKDELAINSNALVLFEHRQTRVFRDSDATISHAAVTFTAVVERAA